MPRQVVQFDFSGGIDESSDARYVKPGELTSLINGQFDKFGSIRKRAGYTGLSRATVSGGSISACEHLAALDDELVMFDGASAYAYASGPAKWVTKDDAGPFGVEPRKTVVHSASVSRVIDAADTYTLGRENISPDVAYANGLYVVTFISEYIDLSGAADDGFGIPRYVVIDATTGARVIASTALESTPDFLAPRLCVVGTNVYAVYSDNAGNLWGRQFDTSTLAWSSATALVTDALAAKTCDYAVSATDRIFVVYRNNSGVTPFVSYTIRTANSTLTALAGNTITTPAPMVVGSDVKLATVATTGETWWVAFAYVAATTHELWVTGRSPSTYAQTIAAFAVDSGESLTTIYSCAIARLSATNAVVMSSGNYNGTYLAQSTYFRQVTTGGATSGAMRVVPHTVLASKPFVSSGRTYAWFCTYTGQTPDSDQETLVCGDLRTDDVASANLFPRPVAVQAPRIAAPDGGLIGTLSGAAVASVVTTGAKLVTVACTNPGLATGRAIEFITLDTDPTWTSAQLGDSLHVSGGLLSTYDGDRFVEASFITYPEAPQTITTLNGSGTLANNGVYQYSLVATWYNSRGEILRSAPSIPVTVTLGAADDTVRFYAMHMPFTAIAEAASSFRPFITYELYRTKNGGTTFYKVPESQIIRNVYSTIGPIINDPSGAAHGWQYEDRAGDSYLDDQPILYTTGGILSGVSPPGSQVVWQHKDRMFLADGEDVWFSTQARTGLLPRWNELLRFSVRDGGPITAGGSIGGYCVIFKRDRIFLVGGEGPDETGGTGQEFSPPQRVASDVGCINPNSIATTPSGIVFQSTAGLYLLTPGGQVQYISGPVQDTLASYPNITSVTVHESDFQVRFASDGVVLVWDYFGIDRFPLGRWSVFQLYDSVADNSASAVAGACNSRGIYHWAAPNGAVYQETPGTYLDAGSTWITLSFETAWFKFAGLQGFQRVWSVALLGEYYTDHTLIFKYAVDYAAAYSTPVSEAVTSAFGLEQLRYVPRTQKCQAMRVYFADSSSGTVGSGRGLSFTGLAFEAKVLPKTNRLAAAKRS
jgi:hypothetical protein